MFFTLIFGDNFFINDLVNYVRDESCRENLRQPLQAVPTS